MNALARGKIRRRLSRGTTGGRHRLIQSRALLPAGGGRQKRKPDARRFPGLQLAWDTLRGPLGATAVMNAANEEAVAAFLERRIGFTAIHAVNAASSCTQA